MKKIQIITIITLAVGSHQLLALPEEEIFRENIEEQPGRIITTEVSAPGITKIRSDLSALINQPIESSVGMQGRAPTSISTAAGEPRTASPAPSTPSSNELERRTTPPSSASPRFISSAPAESPAHRIMKPSYNYERGGFLETFQAPAEFNAESPASPKEKSETPRGYARKQGRWESGLVRQSSVGQGIHDIKASTHVEKRGLVLTPERPVLKRSGSAGSRGRYANG